MMMLETALTSITKLGLDTLPIIYFVEAHPKYDERVTEIFRQIASGKLIGVTSVITLTEVLVHPIRLGEADLQNDYRDLMLNSANFETVFIDTSVAESAADLRARYNLRTPDALQIAVAFEKGCEAFLQRWSVEARDRTTCADIRRTWRFRAEPIIF
jgi:predicted nucleic acid-binding protein